jgi:hypothetical protein
MKPHPFAHELSGLPAAVAAELEDHLMESYDTAIRSGLSEDEAREAALRSLGRPLEIGALCAEQSRPPLSTGQRAAVAVWFLLAVGFATRTCEATDPSHVSIGLCAGLTMASMALALALRRGRVLDVRLAMAASLAMASASATAIVLPSWRAWIHSGMGMSPAFLAVLAFICLAGGMALMRVERRRLWHA